MSILASAMDVLKLIARLRRDITVTDVVTHLGLAKSSASRTLSMMAEYGFLERDSLSRAYRPGSVVMEASYHFRASKSNLSLLEGTLDTLVKETGYTGYINVLDSADSLVILMRTGAGSLQVYTPPGTRAPAYSTSIGRAILARLSDEEVIQLVGSRLELRRGNTPRTHKDLLSRLAEVRASGWSLSRGEFVDNVAGISTAVQDPTTRQVYGLGIALPVQDLSESLIARFGKFIVDTTASVGKQIGDPYWLTFEPAA